MHLDELLTAAVLLLGASAAAIVLFQRAGFGSVLGLLVVGIVLGPAHGGPGGQYRPDRGRGRARRRVPAVRHRPRARAAADLGDAPHPVRAGHAAGRAHRAGAGGGRPGRSAGPGRRPWSWASASPCPRPPSCCQLLAERDELGDRARPRRIGHPAAAGHGGDPAAGPGAAAGARLGRARRRLDRPALARDRRHAGRDRGARPRGPAAGVRR